MTHPKLAVGQLAQADQDLARLADLAAVAARHHAAHCTGERGCAGPAVEAYLEEAEPAERWRLLLIAVAELGRLGYGAPPACPVAHDPRPGRPRGKRVRDGEGIDG